MPWLQKGDDSDYYCDFPFCMNKYDTSSVESSAVIHGNKIIVFCQSHCLRLMVEGVNLRTVKEAETVRHVVLSSGAKRIQREVDFVNSLK